ncbi:MAG: IS66 family insertion sequence element accessory protein TnpB [Betaproteobacteria bacterium]|nr:IS66 family insertion sequence element accessory protein TnpB [Betaproteobacteria bacterium]
MFRLDSRLKVFLHREAVDGRKSINGLALLVEQGLGLDPFAPAAYVFSNRRRDRIKILLWDRNGSGCSSSDWKPIASNGPRGQISSN